MSTPSPKILLAAKVYFVFLLAYFCYAFMDGLSRFDWTFFSPQSPLTDVAIIFLFIVLALAPLIGIFGYAWQRKIAWRLFWRLILVLQFALWISGLLIAVRLGVEKDVSSSLFDFIVWPSQLVALFAYSYRSGHIWNRHRPSSDASYA